jgi:hypothetical protein
MRTRFTCLNEAMCVSLRKIKITRKTFVADAIVGYEMLLGRVLDIDSESKYKAGRVSVA